MIDVREQIAIQVADLIAAEIEAALATAVGGAVTVDFKREHVGERVGKYVVDFFLGNEEPQDGEVGMDVFETSLTFRLRVRAVELEQAGTLLNQLKAATVYAFMKLYRTGAFDGLVIEAQQAGFEAEPELDEGRRHAEGLQDFSISYATAEADPYTSI